MIIGFCVVLLNPPGPLHENVPLPSAFKLIDSSVQTIAPVALTDGFGLTCTETVARAVALHLLSAVTITL